jgi:hypothetical protein
MNLLNCVSGFKFGLNPAHYFLGFSKKRSEVFTIRAIDDGIKL